MLLEDLMRMLNSNTWTEKDIDACFSFFISDLEHEKSCGAYVYSFYTSTVYSFQSMEYFERIHTIARGYIEAKVEIQQFWKLYFIEVVYYYYADSPSEMLKYINKILVLDNDECRKSAIYCYAIMLFLRLEMFKDANSYIDEAEIYISNNLLPEQHKFHLWINEMDVYAASHQHKKYIAACDKLEEFLEKNKTLSEITTMKLYYGIHAIYGKVMLRDQFEIDKAKEAKNLKYYMDKTGFHPAFAEDYATILIPMLRYFDEYFEEEEIISFVKGLFQNIMSCNEKTKFLKFLVEEIQIDKKKYSSIFDDYCTTLSEYYDSVQKNKTYEVKTEILNFSMEKQLNVISAKYQYDTLTGCYNRVFLSEIEESILKPGDIVIYLDLNDFKKINDTYGHETGDRQLKLFADILHSVFENNIVLRLGGDEFVILTRGLPEDVLALLDIARAEYLKHNLLKNRYGFSAGVLLAKGIMIHEAIGLADQAMYDSKKTGLPCIIREI